MKKTILLSLVSIWTNFYSQNVTTFAGSGTDGQNNGVGTSASFSGLRGITLDKQGNIYLADAFKNNIIRKITPGALVSTFAGSIGSEYSPFNGPEDLIFDSNNNLFIIDNSKIKKIKLDTGEVTTFAGSDNLASVDGQGTQASFKYLKGITIDTFDNLYVTELNGTIRKITPAGYVTTIAGKQSSGYNDGIGTAATFYNPIGIHYKDGSLYIVDSWNYCIRKLNLSTNMVTTLSGNQQYATVNGSLLQASYKQPSGITSYGNYLFVAENFGQNIRLIDLNSGMVSTYAGNSIAGDSDGYATAASFRNPSFLTVDPIRKVLYISATGNNKIKKIDMVDLLSSVEQNQSQFVFYPNPVKDVLYFKSDNSVKSVEIFSLEGSLIKKADVTNNQIFLGMLTKGIYIIKATDNKGGIIKNKIIKN